MTNKEKTLLFLKAFGLLLWVGASVVTSVSVLNGEVGGFYKTAAVVNILVNIGFAGKKGYEEFFK